MTVEIYAYYDTNTGLIENTLAIDDAVASTLTWPDGHDVVVIPPGTSGTWSMCGVGWSYIDGQFVEPPQPVA